jgi:hypothetical protein
VKKFSKVLPTVTYCDFGPPLLPPLPCYRATSRRDELARQAGKTVLKFEVGNDDIVKKPSKTPTTMLNFNDLKLVLRFLAVFGGMEIRFG